MSGTSKYAPSTPSYAAAAGASPAPDVHASRWAPPPAEEPFPPLGAVSGVTIVSEAETGPQQDSTTWPPNPHLIQPFLYVSHLPLNVTKHDLANRVFKHCLPVKFELDPSPTDSDAAGAVRFNRMFNGMSYPSFSALH